MKINGNTDVYAIIGHPIAHSLSPVMHNAAFEKLNLNAIYVAFDIQPSRLKRAVEGIKTLGIKGFNVTIPHKTAILPFLDKIDPLAEKISAVNTVKNVNGKLLGFNTDGCGVMKTLESAKISIKGSKIVMIGAGGAAKAISFTLAPLARELVILNRTKKNAIQLAENLSKRFSSLIKGGALSKKNICEELKDAQILINATPVGMYPNVNESIVEKEYITEKLTVLDIVYSPFKTKLLTDAESRGAKILDGVSMLVYQAVEAFKIWTGIVIDPKIMFRAVEKELKKNR